MEQSDASMPSSSGIPSKSAQDLPSISVGFIPSLDATLAAQFPAEFGGVYLDGDYIVINVAINIPEAQALLSGVLNQQDNTTDEERRELRFRPTRLTYYDLNTVAERLTNDEWPSSGANRIRTIRIDYQSQLIVISMVEPTSIDADFARKYLGHDVRLESAPSSDIAQNWPMFIPTQIPTTDQRGG